MTMRTFVPVDDNMRSVVLERRGDAIRIHPTLLELAAHYRFEPRPVALARGNENAYIERFNRTYRDELLNQYLFATLDDVREATYWWMIEYNEERPHDSLGDLTPHEARSQIAGNSTLQLSP